MLKQYAWPGNVRELRNVIERVLILNPKAQRIERKHLPVLVQRDDRPRRRTPARLRSSAHCCRRAKPTSATTS